MVNLLDWYVHPITASDLEDVEMVFEDLVVDWNHLKSMEEAGLYFDVDRVKEIDTLSNAGQLPG